MGAKLLDYYEQAKTMGGLKAQMRLAMITKIPSSKATTEPDSPDNVKIFDNAIYELKKEFK
jgi:hypothetical protein